MPSRNAGPTSTTGFGAWVRSRRVALLLTQEQLAERTGLSVRTVRNLEAGTGSPRESTRQLLSAVLGVLEDRQPVQDPAVPIPAQLPPDVHGFTGRAAELEALDGLLEEVDCEPLALVISAVSGTAGVGKTALAVHWARRVTDRFPDGQLFLDLRGYGPDDPLPAATALEVLLLDLGVSAGRLPQRLDQRMALYRSLLANRRMLVLLDNARSADQVRPLLPGSGTCLVVVTSRDSLCGLVARDGARRLDLDLLPAPDAMLLLRTLLGERVDTEPDAARDIAEHCARLPLALRVTAELANTRRDVPLRTLADELGNEQRRLDLLDAGGDVRTAARAVFSWSYRHLDPVPAHAFRLLGLHPGRQWDATAVAALLGVEVSAAEEVLGVLVRAHLVTLAGPPGRYGMHDLLHAYAAALTAKCDSEDDRRAALTRLFDAYLTGAQARVHTLWPDERKRRTQVASAGVAADAGEAKAWLDTERSNLLAVATHPASRSWSRHAIGLSQILWRYLNCGAHHREATEVHGCALAAARSHGDRDAEATALRYLAAVAWRLGDFDEALRLSGEALALHRQLGDRPAEGRALNTLGVSNYFLGRYHDAIVSYREAHTIAVETGDSSTEGITSNNLGDACLRIGRYAEAIRHLKDALVVRRATGDRAGEGVTIGNLAEAQRAAGRVLEARKSFDRALGLAAEMGDRNTEAYALNGLGLLLQHQRRHGDALSLHQRALAIARDTGNRPVEATALNGLAGAVLASGDVHLSRALHETALGLATDIGERYERGRALEGLARALDAANQPTNARQCWQEALTLYEDLGVPEADALRHNLTTAGTPRHHVESPPPAAG